MSLLGGSLARLLRGSARTPRGPTQVYCPVRHSTVDVESCATCALRASGSTACAAIEPRSAFSTLELLIPR